MIDRNAVYFVEHKETHERKRGSFDCERAAQAFANYLNDKEAKEKEDSK